MLGGSFCLASCLILAALRQLKSLGFTPVTFGFNVLAFLEGILYLSEVKQANLAWFYKISATGKVNYVFLGTQLNS